MNKKATGQIGFAIIAMALLLLLGGLFLDDDEYTKNDFLRDKESKKYDDNGELIEGKYPEESYLFYLNSTDIGRQNKVTESFPNIELGSKLEYNTVYLGNTFRLNANPLTSNKYSFEVQASDIMEVNEFLIYFNDEKDDGDEILKVYINDELVIQNRLDALSTPIKVQNNFNKIDRDLKAVLQSYQENPFATLDEISDELEMNKKKVIAAILKLENLSLIEKREIDDYSFYDVKNIEPKQKITFELIKPEWYEIFNWQKVDFSSLRIVEVKQNKNNNVRDFNFQIDKDFLERVYLDLTISCDTLKDTSEAIKIEVNGYIISNENPKCTSKYNKITTNIPLNILNNQKNDLTLETQGYYKVAYSLNKIYFNDEDMYKFTINNFNDIIDVVMYGDFDKEVIDVRLNEQTMTLGRDDIISIIPYLRFGTNKIEFLTKPVEIEEFVIEKNEFWY